MTAVFSSLSDCLIFDHIVFIYNNQIVTEYFWQVESRISWILPFCD